MRTEAACLLQSRSGDAIPLRKVQMSGRVRGVLFELDIEQHYENLSDSNIETVYTFPLPLHAVLLGLDVTIGERHLTARALRTTAAAERYEGALEQGHSAALLERAGDGLYTVSLGNLMPGERAVIRCRYAQLLEMHKGQLRLCIPTVIAPRYGTASQHLRQPHQIPTTDLSVEYPFALKLTFDDFTSSAAITCPTHDVTVTTTESGLSVVLTPPAWLDRDFVLLADVPPGRSLAVTARDGEGYVALLSCTLTHTPPESSRHALKLLIDCSGSMQGDSIAQARHTTQTILRGLGTQDRVSLLRFGSTLDPLTPGLVPATPTVLEQLCLRVAGMQADLGGTELPEALRALIRQPLEEGYSADVLLVTDAETWDIDAVLDVVKKARHRLFVVAVGATPVEPLVRRLAEETGGACECVTPNEDLERAALRMAARMRQPTYRLGDVRWPQAPVWVAPLPNAVFSGDTVHVVAGFATVPQGAVTLSIQNDPSAVSTPMSVEQSPINVAAVSDAEALPRIAATRRMAAMADHEAAELAERYQLVSRFTSLVLVSERDADKAQQLPTLNTIAQMPAAGWMGAGSLAKKLAAGAAAAPACAAPSAVARTRLRDSAVLPEPPASEHASPLIDYCRPTSPIGPTPGAVANRPTLSPADFLARLLAELQAGGSGPQSWAELANMGMPVELLKSVQSQLNQKISLVPGNSMLEERELVQLWLAVLLEALEPAQYEKAAPEEWRTKVGDRRLRTLRHTLRPLVQKVTPAHWGQPAGHFFTRGT